MQPFEDQNISIDCWPYFHLCERSYGQFRGDMASSPPVIVAVLEQDCQIPHDAGLALICPSENWTQDSCMQHMHQSTDLSVI